MANATHNQILNALAIMLRPSHGCAGQSGIRFGAYMLAFCIFRYHRNSGPQSPRGRSGSCGERVAEYPRGFRSMRGQHGKPVDNPCRSFRPERGAGLDCPRSFHTFRAAAVLKPLRPNIPACQAIARGGPTFVLIAARRSERIRTRRILNRFQFGGGSGDPAQEPWRQKKRRA